MALKLKQFRIKAGMTQAKLAKAVGVSQPNYQRWEARVAPVPEDKLIKLAQVLQVSPEALRGRHPPINAGFYDEFCGEDLNYYGEVAIHFSGAGEPLLLSITDGAFSRLHRDLQCSQNFVKVESLSNQTVFIRTDKIADLYFSSEAYDNYGPENHNYDDHILLQMPDTRDWEIVEALCHGDECALDDYASDDVRRVSDAIMITDEQYKKLAVGGVIDPEKLAAEQRKNEKEIVRIFDLASKIKYQLSNGQQRDISASGAEVIYEAFSRLEEFDGEGKDFIILPIEGAHRTIFINIAVLDYVALPTHIMEQGRLEREGKVLDEGI
ncbi:helix-turn-helix domain-containing protein [Stutzerimonas nitrititolerans]|uniref:helix-turn-helix domain-containing protein n=1 Tax=Stutzerimonas nitrititolerans TaxID=2482751 RepID=UPI00289D7A6E|nr:helix-turn-helix transcriptional regulator [Stutzerimonas nitrititolerans]